MGICHNWYWENLIRVFSVLAGKKGVSGSIKNGWGKLITGPIIGFHSNRRGEWERGTDWEIPHTRTKSSSYPTNIIFACTAKTQYRKFETKILRKGTAGLQSQFIHSCFCERFIYSHDWSAYSAAGKSRIYRSHIQTHECGHWDWGRVIPFLGIHKPKFLCSVIQINIVISYLVRYAPHCRQGSLNM